MRGSIGRALRLLGALLALALLGRSLQLGLEGARFAQLQLRPGALLQAAAAGAAALLVLALASALGARAAHALPRGPAFVAQWSRVWFQSYFYRYIPGKIALVAERVRLGAAFGLSGPASATLVVWESMLLLAAAAVVGSLGLVGGGPGAAGWGSPAQGAAVAVGALLLSSTLFPALRLLRARLPALARWIPAAGASAGLPLQLALVSLNAAAWALLGLSFTGVALSLSGALTAPPLTVAAIFVASYAGGQLAQVAPAGLGVREAFLVTALSPFADPGTTLAWAVAHRLLLALVEFALLAAVQLIPLPTAPAEPAAAPAAPSAP